LTPSLGHRAPVHRRPDVNEKVQLRVPK
jgi:hypothetical protein